MKAPFHMRRRVTAPKTGKRRGGGGRLHNTDPAADRGGWGWELYTCWKKVGPGGKKVRNGVDKSVVTPHTRDTL